MTRRFAFAALILIATHAPLPASKDVLIPGTDERYDLPDALIRGG